MPKIYTDAKNHLTGNQLLEWLKQQTPEVLKRPIGYVGHYGEFYPITTLPDPTTARRDRNNTFGSVPILKFDHVDIEPEPD